MKRPEIRNALWVRITGLLLAFLWFKVAIDFLDERTADGAAGAFLAIIIASLCALVFRNKL